jgi:hypothetical protein
MHTWGEGSTQKSELRLVRIVSLAPANGAFMKGKASEGELIVMTMNYLNVDLRLQNLLTRISLIHF